MAFLVLENQLNSFQNSIKWGLCCRSDIFLVFLRDSSLLSRHWQAYTSLRLFHHRASDADNSAITHDTNGFMDVSLQRQGKYNTTEAQTNDTHRPFFLYTEDKKPILPCDTITYSILIVDSSLITQYIYSFNSISPSVALPLSLSLLRTQHGA